MIKKQEKIKRRHEQIYYENCAILGIPAWFYILLGGRGCGKTYSTQKYCIKKWLKTGEPFIWLRLKEPAVKKILQNNAADFVKPQLRERYGLNKFVVKGNDIYVNDILFCKVMALSTFYQDKGIDINKDSTKSTKTKQLKTTDALANKVLRRTMNGYHTIVLDEMNAERCEKRTIDICYAFVNQLQTICRNKTDKKVFLLGNTLQEGSDILADLFNFLPEEFGIYRLSNKHAVIHYIDDSDKFKEMKATSFSGVLSPNESTFTNKIESDIELVYKKKITGKPSFIIRFEQKRFLVYGDIITNESIPKSTNLPEYPMKPYIVGLAYYKEMADIIKTKAQTRSFKFDKLYTLKQFYKEIKNI